MFLKKYEMETTVNKTESEKGNSSHLRCSNPSKIKAFLDTLYIEQIARRNDLYANPFTPYIFI